MQLDIDKESIFARVHMKKIDIRSNNGGLIFQSDFWFSPPRWADGQTERQKVMHWSPLCKLYRWAQKQYEQQINAVFFSLETCIPWKTRASVLNSLYIARPCFLSHLDESCQLLGQSEHLKGTINDITICVLFSNKNRTLSILVVKYQQSQV